MKQCKDQQFRTQIINSELTYNLRKKVLWPHIKDGNYTIDVDKHNHTFHLGTFVEKNIISIGTFIKENNIDFLEKNQYRLRAMATDSKYRKKGAGKNLFLKAIEILKERNTRILWCSARIKAIPFYEKLNMRSLDKTYNIPNIGLHKTMYLKIN